MLRLVLPKGSLEKVTLELFAEAAGLAGVDRDARAHRRGDGGLP